MRGGGKSLFKRPFNHLTPQEKQRAATRIAKIKQKAVQTKTKPKTRSRAIRHPRKNDLTEKAANTERLPICFSIPAAPGSRIRRGEPQGLMWHEKTSADRFYLLKAAFYLREHAVKLLKHVGVTLTSAAMLLEPIERTKPIRVLCILTEGDLGDTGDDSLLVDARRSLFSFAFLCAYVRILIQTHLSPISSAADIPPCVLPCGSQNGGCRTYVFYHHAGKISPPAICSRLSSDSPKRPKILNFVHNSRTDSTHFLDTESRRVIYYICADNGESCRKEITSSYD